MLYSNYFMPLLKETPKDAKIPSHILMLKCGMIRASDSGLYSWLPLGLRVLDKIQNVIKLEMNKSGAHNLLMSTIQPSSIWVESGRYDDYGLEMLRIKDRHNRDLLYSPTNEEQITQIVRDNIKSYKELPLNLYQIQWKFRDEIRPRFGVMRGREFLMKDSYSFDISIEESQMTYKKMFVTYLRIFSNLGLKTVPMQADTGPIGGDFSHEFMVLADVGESEVFYDSNIFELDSHNKYINYDDNSMINDIFNMYTSYYACTLEKHDTKSSKFIDNQSNITNTRGIEVGQVFHFGNKYTKSMNFKVNTSNGAMIHPYMGSYGIGISRLVAAIIENSHDDKGIIWPKEVSPFLVILSSLGTQDNVVKACDFIYKKLIENNIEVLYNNKNESPGVKLSSADMLGFPYQINVGSRSLENNQLELKDRKTQEIKHLFVDDIDSLLSSLIN